MEKKRKQKKRKQAQRNKNSKNFSVKATGLAELYAGAVKQRFAKHDVKASTSLDTKTLIIVSNRNFESFMSIRCLAPQHIFPFLLQVFSLPLATLLIIVPSSSTFR